MSGPWIDRCMAIPEIKVENLEKEMVEYYAYLYLRISNAVDAMGGMANFSHWMNNHAKNYFETSKLQEKEIQSLKAMIVECRPWVLSRSMHYYDDIGEMKQWLTKTENIRVGE